MSVRSISALDRIYQVRRVQRFSMIFAGAVFTAGSLYFSIARSQKEKVKPIVKQALSICRAFATECQAEGEPRFVREQVPLPSTRAMKRPMWYVPVRADGAGYAMMFRADTGRLCYVFNLSPWKDFDPKQSAKSKPIEANDAVNHSLLYLQRLKMVSPETQIALEEKPELLHDETGWRIIWKTRNTSNPMGETLRVVINHRNGRLLQVADTAALNQTVR